MPSLFSLFVDLKANTAEFVSGMSTASYAAKKAGRDIEESFSTLGSLATAALAPFGEVGAAIGETLARVGEYASTASHHFAELGGGMNAIAVSAGVAAGALAAVGVGAIALAAEAAESAEKMNELSRQTGVSVTALSEWSYVAKQSGVDQETLVKSLQLLSVNMVKAAGQVPGAANAFNRLGVSVKDSNGHLRDAGDVMSEVLEKLSKINPTAAVGLGRQLFGRAGDALLSIEPEQIKPQIAQAHQLGIAIDPQFAQASEKFGQTLRAIEAAGQGAANVLSRTLLPALQTIAEHTLAWAIEHQSAIGTIINVTVKLGEIVLSLADTFWTAFQQIGIAAWDGAKQFGLAWYGVGAALQDALKGNLSGALADLKHYYGLIEDTGRDFLSHSKSIWSENSNFIKGVFGTLPPPRAPKPPGSDNDKQPQYLGVADKDQVVDLLAKLAAQASAELALASSIQTSVAAMTLQKAAGEADVKIAEERTQLLDREKTLRAQLAATQAGPHPEEGAKFKSEIAAVQAYERELDIAAPLIRQRYQEIAAAKLFASTGENLGKENQKFDAEIASLNRLHEAYAEGGSAIAAAQIDQQLISAKQSVADLADEYILLGQKESEAFSQLSAAVASGSVESIGVLIQSLSGADNALSSLGVSLANAQTQLQNLTAKAAAKQIAELTDTIDKQTQSLRGEAAAYAIVSAAAFSSAAAQREAAAQATVAKFSAEHPQATDAQKDAVYKDAVEQQRLQYEQTILQIAQQHDLNYEHDQEIAKLQAAREVLQGYGQSTLDIDAAIYDENQKNIEQWDQAALKVGTFGDRMQAVFNQIQIEGQSWGEKIFSAFNKSIDDASTELAKFVVTGKSNFKQLFESLEESIVKAGLQRLFASVAGIATGHAANGHDSQGNVLGDLTGKNVGTASVIGSLFGNKNSGQDNPLYTTALYGESGDDSGGSGLGNIGSELSHSFTSIFSSIGSVVGKIGSSFGSIFSSIGGFFGGFLAGGGDVSPGKAYVVGEKHPEFFVPRQGGQVVPSLKMQQGHTIQQTFVFQGVKDFDSFQRSRAQMSAQWHRETQIALQRNG